MSASNSRSDAIGSARGRDAAWTASAIGLVALCALLGRQISDGDATAGFAVGAVCAILVVLGADVARRLEAAALSRWEYAAAAATLAFWATVLVAGAIDGDVVAADGLLVFPPVGVAPLLVRWAAGDDGDAAGRARRLAFHLHLVAATVLGALGVLFVVTIFFLALAPIPLAAAALHLGARGDYRRWRADRGGARDDPRLGFMR